MLTFVPVLSIKAAIIAKVEIFMIPKTYINAFNLNDNK